MKFVSPLFSIANKRFNVIILAAGVGSRLKPETDHIPKALVDLGDMRAIDYILLKYQHIANSFIVSIGYCADLLKNYIRGKYPRLNILFSQEAVADLKGPGNSTVYALDSASSRHPTIITFCDYIIEDQFPVDRDALCVCRPSDGEFVYGTYATCAVVEEGTIVELVRNEDMENIKENGFTGVGIFHDTKLLKAIVYGQAADKGTESIDYALDLVNVYVRKVKTEAIPVFQLYEFGTDDTLKKTREIINAYR